MRLILQWARRKDWEVNTRCIGMLKESTGAKQNPTNLSDLPENRKSVDKREDTPVCNCNKSEHKSASNLNDVSYKDV